ncbi:MAG: arginine--tRNA ligase [Deltaproteobacteria bacterium]|nr:MAG: arginine--tRNA ligase [Deltaproteobacteria bacterium]
MSMKRRLARVINQSLQQAQATGSLNLTERPTVQIEVPKITEHGDFATNVAMILASQIRRPPRQVAEIIIQHLDAPAGMLDRLEIAGPGFINFFIQESYWYQVLKDIQTEGEAYGQSDRGRGLRVQVEFVSANPTGPLHIGHGRGAAVGDALANILAACGYQVEREYYINDLGTQMRTLGLSLYLRLRQLQGQEVDFPDTCYQGDYVIDLARQYQANHGPLAAGEPSEADLQALGAYAGAAILAEIRQDLDDFGVHFDHWFSEAQLFQNGSLERALAFLQDQGYLYETEGALWFKATAWGDEKDRVVRRRNGATTYFASDVAYHWNKIKRGYDQVVDIWGADHHGYVPRLKAAVQALGTDAQFLKVILVQLVSLLRQGQPVAMTTRGGTFVTLREVIDEVGKDAARFIFLSRRSDAHLDFDLDLAKQQSAENPVYYVQYAHARLASVFRLAAEREIDLKGLGEANLNRLNLPEEIALIKLLASYPDVVEAAAQALEPHRVTYFLTDLAAQFHSYYYKHRFISESEELTQARLFLVQGIKTVLAQGLQLLGVKAPKSM